jgi:hypothetical protein
VIATGENGFVWGSKSLLADEAHEGHKERSHRLLCDLRAIVLYTMAIGWV